MNPNIYIEEKRLLERVQHRLRETEQRSPPAAIRQAPHQDIVHHLIASLGARFIVLGARMQQFAQADKHQVPRGRSASLLIGRDVDCSASVQAGRGGANGVTSAPLRPK
jgi:hypothetical protein